MNPGVHVCRCATVGHSVFPRSWFMLFNQVEVQLTPHLRNHFARDGWLCKPLHGKHAALRSPDECHGIPLVITDMRGVAVAKLDVLAGPIDGAFLPPPSLPKNQVKLLHVRDAAVGIPGVELVNQVESDICHQNAV